MPLFTRRPRRNRRAQTFSAALECLDTRQLLSLTTPDLASFDVTSGTAQVSFGLPGTPAGQSGGSAPGTTPTDADYDLGPAVTGLVSSGAYNWPGSITPWSYVQSQLDTWDGLRPWWDVRNVSNIGGYSSGGMTYVWSNSISTTASSSGSQGESD